MYDLLYMVNLLHEHQGLRVRVRVWLRQSKDGSGCGRLRWAHQGGACGHHRLLLGWLIVVHTIARHTRMQVFLVPTDGGLAVVLFGRRAAPAPVLWIIRIILYYLLIHIMYFDTLAGGMAWRLRGVCLRDLIDGVSVL